MYIAVLDFEATCANKDEAKWDPSKQEIIELPVGVVSIAERRTIATFGTFVRPLHQPTLTAFCRDLTGIAQRDVNNAPTIHQAMAQLTQWFAEHGLDETNTLIASCGDWDLKTMWPTQVGVEPMLPTPRLFRQWCNLKTPYAEHMQHKAGGMMGMLEKLGLEHQGRHHRGADDVANLCRIVSTLIARGVTLSATWSDEERTHARAAFQRKWSEAQADLRAKEQGLAALPSKPEMREQMATTIARLRTDVERFRAQRDVFD